jgi:cytochrome P450
VSILESLFRVRHRAALDMVRSLPGPTPIAVFGNALAIAGNPLHTLFERWRERYGDTVVFWIFGQPSLVTAKPDLIADVLVDQEANWLKNLPRDATKPVGGQSVFRSPGGAEWKEKRAAHPFEMKWVDDWYEGVMPALRQRTTERLEAAAPAGPLDLYEEILKASFDCFSLGVFGTTLPPRAFVEHESLLREVGRRGALPIAVSLDPIFWWRRWQWFSRLEARMAEGDKGGTDMISALARNGADLKSRRARDELGNIFAAGMKNAAIAASATTFFLSKSPEALTQVRAELDAAGPGLSRKTLVELPYFDRAVKEALRLVPPVAGFAREVKPDRVVSFDGVALPPRTQLFLVPWLIQRDARHWPDPLRFDPDRFLAPPARGTYFPFGLGARFCVGREWTLLVTKSIVSALVTRWSAVLDPGVDFETTLVAALTVPKNGLKGRLAPR